MAGVADGGGHEEFEMKRDITVVAEPRETRGKNEARRLRARGLAPAVVYGGGADAVAVSVQPKQLLKILHSRAGQNTIFRLQTNGGDGTPVIIADWQNDPIRGNLLHVDLKRIDMTQRITVKVPVHIHGEPRGVKQQGGLLEIVTREIEIECLPDDIPEQFDMDATELLIGQNLRIAEVPLTKSMKLVSTPESVIAHVIALRATAEETEAEAAAPAAAEPEVIKKGKKEEEGGDEKGKKK